MNPEPFNPFEQFSPPADPGLAAGPADSDFMGGAVGKHDLLGSSLCARFDVLLTGLLDTLLLDRLDVLLTGLLDILLLDRLDVLLTGLLDIVPSEAGDRELRVSMNNPGPRRKSGPLCRLDFARCLKGKEICVVQGSSWLLVYFKKMIPFILRT